MNIAVPRPAASVVLTRMRNGQVEVFMTKRPESMKFMPGFFVFPGGGVSEGDRSFPVSHLEGYPEGMTVEDKAYMVAATREIFEEVGILLGKLPVDSPLRDPQVFEDRRRDLNHKKVTFADIVSEANIRLDLSNLRYFGRRVTPPMSPMRFDTRFYLAICPEDQQPQPDPREVVESFWITPKKALEGARQKKWPIAPPTTECLHVLQSYDGHEVPMLSDEPDWDAHTIM